MLRFDSDNLIAFLRSQGIDRLYHITDRANWHSIKEYGLHSLESLENNSITVDRPGSDKVDQTTRRKKGLGKYVQLSLTGTPKFLATAVRAERISDAVVLEISLNVFRDPETALLTRSLQAPIVKTNDIIESIKDSIANGTDALQSIDVLVAGLIPRSYILNLDEIDKQTTHQNNAKRAIIIGLDCTSYMSSPQSITGKYFPTTAAAAQRVADTLISFLLEDCDTKDGLKNNFDVCLLKQAAEIEHVWKSTSTNPFRDIYSLYRESMRRLIVDGAKTRFSKESEPQGEGNPAELIREMSKIAQEWSFMNQKCPPPLVLYVTNGLSLRSHILEVTKEVELLKSSPCSSGCIPFFCYMLKPGHNIPITFMSDIDSEELADEDVCRLFSLSSDINDKEHLSLTRKKSKAFCINGDVTAFLTDFIK